MAQLQSMFDVMNGLEWPIDALELPHKIIKVENEHEYVVLHNHLAPIPAPGLDEVGEREQVPDMGQHPPLDPEADLACALENFQELDLLRFGVSNVDVSSEGEIIYELAGDYPSEDESYPSEDESMVELPPAGNSPNPSIVCDLQVEGVAQVQD